MANLIEGIQEECNRLRKFIPIYEEIGPAGMFGKAIIQADIQRGEASIAGGDVVEMLGTYTYLKEQDPS